MEFPDLHDSRIENQAERTLRQMPRSQKTLVALLRCLPFLRLFQNHLLRNRLFPRFQGNQIYFLPSQVRHVFLDGVFAHVLT